MIKKMVTLFLITVICIVLCGAHYKKNNKHYINKNIHIAGQIDFTPINYCSVKHFYSHIPVLEEDINNKNISTSSNTVDIDYTQSEIEMLARIIQAEAVGEPYDGKVAVGAVVLNRVDNDWYPNTIEGVIFQKHQFSGVNTKLFHQNIDKECLKAAKEALKGVDPVNGALFFCNKKLCNPNWIKETKFIKRIGDHWFYK